MFGQVDQRYFREVERVGPVQFVSNLVIMVAVARNHHVGYYEITADWIEFEDLSGI